MIRKSGLVAYYLAAILTILFGGMYMFKPSFMPYHADIAGMGWDEFSSPVRALIRALMIATGGATISIGLMLMLLTEKFRRTKLQWVSNYVFISVLIAGSLMIVAPVYAMILSTAVPPFYFSIIIIVFATAGFFLNRKRK